MIRNSFTPLVLALSLAGCATPTDEAAVEAEPGDKMQAEEDIAYPGAAWETGEPKKHGLSEEGLANLDLHAEATGSTCVLVVHDGVVVNEWYAPGYGPDTVHANIFSVTKSVASALVGIASEDGLLDIDDSASDYIPSWVGTESEAITVRNLLSNDSGRFWSIESDYGSLFYDADQTAYGIGLAQEVPVGTHWEYNNAAIQTLEQVLEVATSQDVDAYAQENLFAPIGMEASFGRDAVGNALVYQGICTSCHDLARFGYLMLQGGRWKGQQIIPGSWATASTTPSTALNDAYGYLWWLNREGHVVEPTFPFRVEYDGRLAPGSSENVYSAIGAFGQLVVVDPDDGYVVVRMQEVLDINDAIANDPDPLGTSKVEDLMTVFEAAKLCMRQPWRAWRRSSRRCHW